MDQDIGDHTRTYWTHKELAKQLHVSRVHMYRLLENGQMLPPDIVIAGSDSFGWDPERALRFGVETDRLTADHQKLVPPMDQASQKRAQMLVKGRYAAKAQVYLSSWLCSFVYDLKENAVYFLRDRKSFFPADVQLANRFGWKEEKVIEFGEQTGRLDDVKIDRWARRRTAEFGLSPEVAWVKERIANRPGLDREIQDALEQWEASQRAAAGA